MKLVSERVDVAVIGGGPAGLTAAIEVARRGLTVTLVDDRPTLGGQIFKRPGPGFRVTNEHEVGHDYRRGSSLISKFDRSGADVLLRTSVVAIRDRSIVVVPEGGPAGELLAAHVVAAPGAHDRPVAFPGWTLPGVITAGAAQTLVKTQRVLPGRDIVFAGSGPLAVAFPAQLLSYGANVNLVLEAGPSPTPRDVIRLARVARGNTHLLHEAQGYLWKLLRAGVRPRYRRIVVRAVGNGRVEEVVHSAVDSEWRPLAGTEETTAADTLCIGYGFFPSVELLRLAGCAFRYDENLGGPVVVADEWRRTTVPHIFAAGDGTGVTGSATAVLEGRLAALGVLRNVGAISHAESNDLAAPIRVALRRKEAFRRALLPMHRIPAGIYELATAETTICRCEEVTASAVAEAVDATSDVNVVKTLTRAGMGLCQGRNCVRQIAATIAARHQVDIGAVAMPTPRAPVRPVPVASVADESLEDEGFFTVDA